MSLAAGSWNIIGNGTPGTLAITSVDGNGNVAGTVFGNSIQGFWDDTAQKLCFTRTTNQGDPSSLQIYTGYLFQNDQTFTLAGSFQAFSGSGAIPTHSVYGWYAQRS